MQPSMTQRRQFDRLQTYFDRNDTEGAERFLRRWPDNAVAAGGDPDRERADGALPQARTGGG